MRGTQKASALINLGRYDESLIAAKTAAELAPQSWRVTSVLAQALACVGQYDSAVDAAERAVDLCGESEWRSFVMLADVLGRANLFTESQAAWERATLMHTELSLDYLDNTVGGPTDFIISTSGLRAAGIS